MEAQQKRKRNRRKSPIVSDLIPRYELIPMIKVCGRTFDRMRAAGSFPPADKQIGRCLYWRRTTYEKWLETRGVCETDPAV